MDPSEAQRGYPRGDDYGYGEPEVEAAPSAPPAAPPAAAPVSAASAAPAVAASAASMASDATERVKEAAEGAAAFFKKNMVSVVFWIVVAAFVAFGVAYFLYYIITRTLINRKGFLLPETKVPSPGTSVRKASGTGIPAIGNGKRMTVAFWIYIHDPERFKGTYRHVWHRGDEAVDGTTSPVVFLDSSGPQMYVMFAQNSDAASPITMAQPFTGTDLPTYLSTRGIAIDYIPIQRWVHVAVVVNEDVNGGTITAYVDSELVKVTATPIQNLNLDKKGDIYIGGDLSSPNGPGFSGLVGKIQFYNYDMNAKDVYDVYSQGPVDNLFAKLGLPSYGVRSPIYRVA